MKTFKKVVDRLCVLGAVLGGVAMFLMMVQVGLDVTFK